MLVTLFSCKKEKENCYECEISYLGLPNTTPGTYQDAGCMTAEEWDKIQLTNVNGDLIPDKDAYCRKKR
jgi:hypothetical protein